MGRKLKLKDFIVWDCQDFLGVHVQDFSINEAFRQVFGGLCRPKKVIQSEGVTIFIMTQDKRLAVYTKTGWEQCFNHQPAPILPTFETLISAEDSSENSGTVINSPQI